MYASDGATAIDTLTYGEQTTDISYGRLPDGSDSWQSFTDPTSGKSNSTTEVANEDNKQNLMSSFNLNQNYPNPFNPETHISYQIPRAAKAKLAIYNLQGKEIITLVNEQKAAGHYPLKWNGLNSSGIVVASGVYLYKIETDNFKQAKMMILVR